ncbi:hypothetical protein EMIT0111MI5_10603 [Burkholderia sp. IT-111MI5]
MGASQIFWGRGEGRWFSASRSRISHNGVRPLWDWQQRSRLALKAQGARACWFRLANLPSEWQR